MNRIDRVEITDTLIKLLQDLVEVTSFERGHHVIPDYLKKELGEIFPGYLHTSFLVSDKPDITIYWKYNVSTFSQTFDLRKLIKDSNCDHIYRELEWYNGVITKYRDVCIKCGYCRKNPIVRWCKKLLLRIKLSFKGEWDSENP